MRLTHFVRRHVEENQRIRDHPVRASLSAFTPVSATTSRGKCGVHARKPGDRAETMNKKQQRSKTQQTTSSVKS
ncbi:hypothetical protein [Bifidobacterium thermophilum]|uniref:hypothetical protein n=1 Tax=Bifidobacterium thermophilum TaxID=33905 RepID=UPI0015D655DE|nr:hypothetical protein [Bifidobacterium thermophilum]